MSDVTEIQRVPEVWAYTLTVHTDDGVVEAAPRMVRSGQVVEPRVTMDSASGHVGTAEIVVFDAVR